MKLLLASLLVLAAVTANAQQIIGGAGSFKNPFEVTVVSPGASFENGNHFDHNSNNNGGYVSCRPANSTDFAGPQVGYRNRLNEKFVFLFDDAEKCKLVLACLQSRGNANGIKFLLDRNTKRVATVALPAGCSLDPLAE